jgi:lipoprotein-anchoring transpeptidase ErfK/SrfK
MRAFFLCWVLCVSVVADEVNTQPMRERAESAFQAGRLEEARSTLLRVASVESDPAIKNAVLDRVGEINIQLLFSRMPQTESVRVQVLSGDTLEKIAKRAGTTIELLRKSNQIQGDRIRLGQQLKVVNLPFTIKVDKSENTAVVYLGGQFFKRYRVSTGAKENTPEGEFTIVSRIVHPDWWHPQTGERIPYGDPEHKIGTHWLGWDRKGFGFHGTDEPDKIGQPVSLGCVRLRNEDVEELYTLLPRGAVVTVVR